MNQIKRGDIYWADLPYNQKYVITKKRPCLVVSNDKANVGSSTLQIVPMTSSSGRMDLPCHVQTYHGVALCEDIMTIDRNKLCDYMSTLDKRDMRKVDTGLLIQLGFIG